MFTATESHAAPDDTRPTDAQSLRPATERLGTAGRVDVVDLGRGAVMADDVERQFLEPVARYLAILREWSLERLSDGTGTVPPEQP